MGWDLSERYRTSDLRFETPNGQTFRLQTDITAGNVAPTYGKSHCAGRFLDSARNDRKEEI